MWEDPIVAEVRQIRETYAKKYNYDLRAMYQALKAQENAEAGEKVSLPAKLVQTTEPRSVQLHPAHSIV